MQTHTRDAEHLQAKRRAEGSGETAGSQGRQGGSPLLERSECEGWRDGPCGHWNELELASLFSLGGGDSRRTGDPKTKGEQLLLLQNKSAYSRCANVPALLV